jgi:protoporphyrinogen oxidase
MSRDSAVIIGAGPAGLTAAYELRKRGVTASVLEASTQVGGLSRTANYRGYRFDIGGHRFFSKVPLINELWQEILGEEFLLRPRLSRIYYNQHFFNYPLKPINALVGLGPAESLLIGLSYLRAKFIRNHDEKTFEEWVSNRFGYRLYRTFFKTYTEKVWGIPCNEISADWAAQRIKNLSLKEAVRNAVLGAKQRMDGTAITSLIEQFYYPRFGPGMMWEQCEAALAKQGTVTLRGMKVEQIHHRQERVECVTARTETGERVEYDGAHFISTMPLRELIHALDPLPPEEVLRAAQGLRYRDYLTVVLVVNRESLFPDNWIYIHSPDVKMGRIQNYKNWSPHMVPDPRKTSLGLEYFLWDKDEEWTWSDDRLIHLGTQECARLGLIDPREVEDGTVVRMEKAYPVYDQSYQEHIKTVRRYLESFSNFQTIGRNGLHRYNNQDHSMLTGVYAARNVTGERYDVWSVNTEKEYLEEGRSVTLSHGDRLVPVPVTVPVEETIGELDDDVIEAAFARVDPLALGVAVGWVSGVVLLLATAILLLKGGEHVGQTLSLLRNYVPGFEVTWTGATIGCLEVGLMGFGLGYLGAWLRNRGIQVYALFVRWRSGNDARRHLLDKV